MTISCNLIALALFYFAGLVLMVKLEDFKTCEQSGFCVRHRAFAKYVDKVSDFPGIPENVASIIKPLKETIEFNDKFIRLKLTKGKGQGDLLDCRIVLFANGIVRITIEEDGNGSETRKGRGAVQNVMINEHSKRELNEYYLPLASYKHSKKSEGVYLVETDLFKLIIDLSNNFLMKVFNSDGEIIGIFNNNRWLKFEVSEFDSVKFSENNATGNNESMTTPSPVPDDLSHPNDLPDSEEEPDEVQLGPSNVNVKPELSNEDSMKERLNRGKHQETFKGHTDKKFHGPMSIGVDFTFTGSSHLFGLAEHSDGPLLKSTKGPNKIYNDPYRLYNLDVFEYDLNVNTALYGAVPLVLSHKQYQESNKSWTSGFFWLNSAETWVDVEYKSQSRSDQLDGLLLFQKGEGFVQNKNEEETQTHWFSETGLFDCFILVGGSSTADVYKQYSSLTGSSVLPQLFALGYHQCRWNYNDEEDVYDVINKFEDHQIPLDVIWLDIEHTEDKKYFTWDYKKFKNPTKMLNYVAGLGRKMVTIIDPHIKKDENYHVYSKSNELNLLVKKPNDEGKEGEIYNGWCWPGESVYLDFLNSGTRRFWMELFSNYKDSTYNLFTWNDMNEPSVFNGPEITMPKDNLHHNGIEHRDIHNIYGLLQHRSTYSGHIFRTLFKKPIGGELVYDYFERRKSVEKGAKPQRPFVLSRSFFAGTQRFGAIWTGDNMAKWEHLEKSIPMLLSVSLSGIPFCGADVGGFFFDPTEELLVRWYQSGLFYPFFRAHAHIDTKRREPWLFGDDNLKLIKRSIETRYNLIFYYYTLFRNAQVTGELPILRPLWYEFSGEKDIMAIEDEFMVGPCILVKPIVKPLEKSTSINVFLPGKNLIWYNFYSHVAYSSGLYIFSELSLKSLVPVFVREGFIVPLKEQARRSAPLMIKDPFSLVVGLNNDGKATGEVYYDDGESFDYIFKGKFVHKIFKVHVEKEIIIKISDKPASEAAGLKSDIWSKPFMTELYDWSKHYEKMTFTPGDFGGNDDEFSNSGLASIKIIDYYGKLNKFLKGKSGFSVYFDGVKHDHSDKLVSIKKHTSSSVFGTENGFHETAELLLKVASNIPREIKIM